MPGAVRVEVVDGDADAAGLAALLVACVDAGASVGFLAPLPAADAVAWWRTALADGGTTWVARDGAGGIAGCVRLLPATAPNSPHRADVVKLLVAPTARRAGVARRLMAAMEAHAVESGRWLLVLDTETGSVAEEFYRACGWRPVGSIPRFALTPAGDLAGTTIYVKELRTTPA